MQNEILKPVLATDEVAVPRYDVVGANGQVLQQNVELRLKNEVVQQGTPYSAEAVLPNELAEQLGLPTSATPADAFAAVIAKSGSKVSMNAPTAQDNVEAGYSIGSLWLRPSFELQNHGYNTTAESFTATACTVAKSEQTFTVTGNGDDKVISVTNTLVSNNGWLYALITPDATAVTAKITAGDVEQELIVGVENVVTLAYSGTNLTIEATYATANVASSGTITIQNLTVIDKTQTRNSGADANRDITPEEVYGHCVNEAPFIKLTLATKLWQQAHNGDWILVYGVDQYTLDMYKLDHASSLNDILMKLAMPFGYYGFDVTTKFSDGTVAPNILLEGLEDLSGGAVMTDANGRLPIAVAQNQVQSVSVSGYLDVVDTTVTITADVKKVFTPVTIVLEKKLVTHNIQSSMTVRTTGASVYDITAIGGGGGGAEGDGGGGGGGYMTTKLGVAISAPTFAITIGGGGGVAATGGQSLVKDYSGTTLIVADGGRGASGNTGGAGNGKGGNSNNAGEDAVGYLFDDETLGVPGGGGGGGTLTSYSGTAGSWEQRPGGKPYGGGGGHNFKGEDWEYRYYGGTAGSVPGGGGGAGNGSRKGAAGGAGAVFLRARFE